MIDWFDIIVHAAQSLSLRTSETCKDNLARHTIQDLTAKLRKLQHGFQRTDRPSYSRCKHKCLLYFLEPSNAESHHSKRPPLAAMTASTLLLKLMYVLMMKSEVKAFHSRTMKAFKESTLGLSLQNAPHGKVQ